MIESLTKALNETLDASEEQKDEFDSIDPQGYQFRTNIEWMDIVNQRGKKQE